ncbi:cobalamin-binding protein [Bacillus sp. SJS]|uniref:cobalamin-binding protein n=1 Tax=Bacillus sp. SJS TaxID=1423321 RepID=UPI000691606E|nr:cobalamin-binding protein [Bacillus sp. SJS]KZZ83422.1 cobalamin-binding protein [Bacillus sp. SJS]
MKIVSICPSNTELTVCLGLADQLVGLDDFSDWPEEIKHLPRLGPDLSIRMDDLEKCEPDLVLASLSVPGMEKNIEELERRNLPYMVFDPQSFEDLNDDLMRLGERTGCLDKAQEKTKVLRSIVKQFEIKSLELSSKPSVYFEWWPKPIFTPGGTNWLTEMSCLAGGENIFSQTEIPSIQTDWEDILTKDPDYFFLVWVGVKESKMKIEHVQKRTRSSELSALRNGRVIMLQEALFCRPSPRLYEGLANLAAILHPDHFKDEISLIRNSSIYSGRKIL